MAHVVNQIHSSRGPIASSLDRPWKPNGTVVVLAPGQGYHRELPLLKQGAQALVKAGFHAVRFDWRYHTAGGKPSAGLKEERLDLKAAVLFARSIEGVERIILAGKSMGAGLALDFVCEDRRFAALALLTLPIRPPASTVADKLARIKPPVLIINASTDPLCDLKTLFQVAQAPKHAPQIVIVPGNHALAGSDESVDVAVQSLVVWAKQWI